MRSSADRNNNAATDQEKNKGLAVSLLRSNCLLKDALEGTVNGKKSSRQKKKSDDRQQYIYGSYAETKRRAENREDWRCCTGYAVKDLPLDRKLCMNEYSYAKLRVDDAKNVTRRIQGENKGKKSNATGIQGEQSDGKENKGNVRRTRIRGKRVIQREYKKNKVMTKRIRGIYGEQDEYKKKKANTAQWEYKENKENTRRVRGRQGEKEKGKAELPLLLEDVSLLIRQGMWLQQDGAPLHFG
ncbi:hypothetical protein ANN_11517, partial [Periplaneta americana]